MKFCRPSSAGFIHSCFAISPTKPSCLIACLQFITFATVFWCRFDAELNRRDVEDPVEKPNVGASEARLSRKGDRGRRLRFFGRKPSEASASRLGRVSRAQNVFQFCPTLFAFERLTKM